MQTFLLERSSPHCSQRADHPRSDLFSYMINERIYVTITHMTRWKVAVKETGSSMHNTRQLNVCRQGCERPPYFSTRVRRQFTALRFLRLKSSPRSGISEDGIRFEAREWSPEIYFKLKPVHSQHLNCTVNTAIRPLCSPLAVSVNRAHTIETESLPHTRDVKICRCLSKCN